MKKEEEDACEKQGKGDEEEEEFEGPLSNSNTTQRGRMD